jgi:hypothetical protein
VVNLDHAERALRRWEVACEWFIDAGGLTAIATLGLDLFRYTFYAAPDRISMRRGEASIAATGDDYGDDMLNRWPLASEIDLLDNQ